MRVLALDASGADCAAALLDGAVCLGQAGGGDSRGAAQALPVIVRALLNRYGEGLDGIGVCVGPGSFTGLRASIALAHGIAVGAGVPVVGVTVAEVLLRGWAAPADSAVWIALDGRRAGRVFLVRCGAVTAEALDDLPRPDGRVLVIGDAAAAVVAALCRVGHDARAAPPHGVDMLSLGLVAAARLADTLPPCAALPLYVELPEARVAMAMRPIPA